jgi:tetratricopeptide (TPR) repeat protein
MPWIERTFDRALVYGPAHFLLARSLVRASPSQARMEYRYAAEQDGGIAHHCVKESLPLINDFDDAMEVVPRGRGGLDVLEMLAEGLAQRLPSTRVRLDEEILARNPRAVQPLERRFQDVIVDVEAGDAAPWCALQHAECVQRGEEIAKRLIEIEPTRCAPYELRARLLSAAGDSKHALDALQQATDRVNDRETCLTALARMAHAAHDDTREGMALEKLEHAGCAKESDCIGEWMDLARLQEGRGEKSHAMALYKRVLERDPDNETALAAEARLAADVGMHAAALAAYVRLSQRHPDDANYARAAAAERAALYMPKQ